MNTMAMVHPAILAVLLLAGALFFAAVAMPVPGVAGHGYVGRHRPHPGGLSALDLIERVRGERGVAPPRAEPTAPVVSAPFSWFAV